MTWSFLSAFLMHFNRYYMTQWDLEISGSTDGSFLAILCDLFVFIFSSSFYWWCKESQYLNYHRACNLQTFFFRNWPNIVSKQFHDFYLRSWLSYREIINPNKNITSEVTFVSYQSIFTKYLIIFIITSKAKMCDSNFTDWQ